VFAVCALHAGKGRGVPVGLDFDEFAVESAGDLAGLIIDRMDGPVGHVVAPGARLQGVGLNPMAAFGARFPRHDAYRMLASSVVLSGCEPSRTAPERALCVGVGLPILEAEWRIF
jgi:hypothetical protein